MHTVFDKIYVISLITNKERQEFIKYQMNELGLEFEFIYGIDYTNLIIDSEKNPIIYPKVLNNNTNEACNFGCTIGHYQAVLQAYEFGYNNVLIIEDDVCFIKDKKLIEYYLNNIPKETDFITWDPRFIKNRHNKKEEFINLIKENNDQEYTFLPNDYEYICGGMMYAIMNKETMLFYLNNQRNWLKMSDHVEGFFENPIIERYVSNKCLCTDQYNIANNFKSKYYCYNNIYKKIYKLNIKDFYKPKTFKVFSRQQI